MAVLKRKDKDGLGGRLDDYLFYLKSLSKSALYYEESPDSHRKLLPVWQRFIDSHCAVISSVDDLKVARKLRYIEAFLVADNVIPRPEDMQELTG